MGEEVRPSNESWYQNSTRCTCVESGSFPTDPHKPQEKGEYGRLPFFPVPCAAVVTQLKIVIDRGQPRGIRSEG